MAIRYAADCEHTAVVSVLRNQTSASELPLGSGVEHGRQ
jgi:hypothetical protein